METQELVLRYFPFVKSFVKKHWFPLSLGILGLMFFAYGLIGLFIANQSPSNDIVFESSTEQSLKETETILVDIEGAVVKPGVYKLPQDSRIQDGLIAAGGLSAQADREYIARSFNLATKLTDGAKVYIPSVGEAVETRSALSSQIGSVDGLVNVNTVSQSQLEALPGIGPVTAAKIIAGRPYGSVQELLDKKIVGSKVFGQIKDRVTVY